MRVHPRGLGARRSFTKPPISGRESTLCKSCNTCACSSLLEFLHRLSPSSQFSSQGNPSEPNSWTPAPARNFFANPKSSFPIIVCCCVPLWRGTGLYCFYYCATTIIIYYPNVKGLWTKRKKSDLRFQSQTFGIERGASSFSMGGAVSEGCRPPYQETYLILAWYHSQYHGRSVLSHGCKAEHSFQR